MPSITVSDEVHERLRVRAHRSGRSMSGIANALLTKALDHLDAVAAQNESATAMDRVTAVTREKGPEAGFQALLAYAGAEVCGPGFMRH